MDISDKCLCTCKCTSTCTLSTCSRATQEKQRNSQFCAWNTAEFKKFFLVEFRGNSANLKPIPAEVRKYEVKIPAEFHPDGIPWASSFPLTISTNPSKPKHPGHKASDEIFKRVRL